MWVHVCCGSYFRVVRTGLSEIGKRLKRQTPPPSPWHWTVSGLTLSGISTIIRSSSKIVDTGDTASFF